MRRTALQTKASWSITVQWLASAGTLRTGTVNIYVPSHKKKPSGHFVALYKAN